MTSRLLLAVVLAAAPAAAQHLAPDGSWLAYADPTEAGFDRERLAAARELWEASDSAALMVVHDGAVVVAWGDVTRRYMCHSARKSVLSALIGVAVDRDELETEVTLGELGIDEPDRPLTDVEKTARVSDLLKARSGIYMTAAYEPPQNPKPERGAHPPGRHWVYNNWDFNTLATIYTEQTGRDLFEAMTEDLFAPIGTQDWRVTDGYLHHQPDMSAHPAYPLRMSARDMARFGQLFLNEGTWGDERVLSANWVRRSRVSYSDSWTGGYGLMWWTFEDNALAPYDTYAALGVGQQLVAVMPPEDLVVVNRTDTYAGDSPSLTAIAEVVAAVVEARTGEAVASPRRVPLVVDVVDATPVAEVDGLDAWTGSYARPPASLGLDARASVDVTRDGSSLVAHDTGFGTFRWTSLPDGTLLVEDALVRLLPWSPKGRPAAPGEPVDGFVRWEGLVNAGYTAWVEGDRERAARCFAPVQRHFGGRAATEGSAVIAALLDGRDTSTVTLADGVAVGDVVEWLGRIAEGLESEGGDAIDVADLRAAIETLGAGG